MTIIDLFLILLFFFGSLAICFLGLAWYAYLDYRRTTRKPVTFIVWLKNLGDYDNEEAMP